VAFGVASSIILREKALGLSFRHPSENYIYAQCRARHNGSWDNLQDTGTYIRAGVRAVRHGGCPDEAAWPSKLSTINKVPDPLAMKAAYDRRGLDYYAVSAGQLDELDEALSAGFFPVFGMDVSSDFMSVADDRVIDAMTGKPRGGHCMVIAAPDLDGTAYWVLNSWGVGWGDLGWCRMSREVVKWNARDITAITGWNLIVGRQY
jgi:hypothetical protein